MIAEARAELALASVRGSSSPPRSWSGPPPVPDRGLPLPPARPLWPASSRASDLADRTLPRFLVRKLRAACERLLPVQSERDVHPPALAVERLRAVLEEHLEPADAARIVELVATAVVDLARAAERPPSSVAVRAVVERSQRRPLESTAQDDEPPAPPTPARRLPHPIAHGLEAALDAFEAASRETPDARDPLLDRVLPALRETLARHLHRPSADEELP